MMYPAELESETYNWDPTNEILTVTKKFKRIRFSDGLRKVRVTVNFNKPARMISHYSNVYKEQII
jgi:hypothetical protein